MYRHLARIEGVCGGRTVIKGTRLEPRHIVDYGSIKDIMRDFNLTIDQVKECYRYVGNQQNEHFKGVAIEMSVKLDCFKLEKHMQETIEYFREIEHLSLYGILHRINSENKTYLEFYHHSQKVLKHFNDFNQREDDENFMKCLLGFYELR